MARIPEHEIERLKRDVDLVELVQSSGVSLKRRGSNLVGLCPFHEDTSPSFVVTPSRNLFHCLGCGQGGDPIEFVKLRDGVSFRQAVEKLTSGNGRPSNGRPPEPSGGEEEAAKDESSVAVPAERRELILQRAVELYGKSFWSNLKGLDYLTRRGISDPELLREHQVGLSDGALLKTVPKRGQLRDELKAVGLITRRGRELFSGCLVFPTFQPDGRIGTLYGRKLRDGAVNHLYLPGQRCGLFNGRRLQDADRVILVESILDGLALIQAGHTGALPLWGTRGFTAEHEQALEQAGIRELTLALDSDGPGRVAADELTRRLVAQGHTIHQLRFPGDHDPASFLLENPAEAFEQLISEARVFRPSNNGTPPSRTKSTNGAATGSTTGASATGAPEPSSLSRPASSFFHVDRDGRQYEVRPLGGQRGQLRCVVKAIREREGERRAHADNLDLTSARARAYFAGGCCELFESDVATISEDLMVLLEQAESWKPPTQRPTVVEISDEDRQEAMRFLTSPKIFEEILQDLETLGYTGEELNKLVCYLGAVSRKMDRPLSILIQSRSAAGKSALQKAVLALVPPEDFVHYSRISGQALFYMEQNALKHKLVAIEEESGATDASYSIRIFQSAGRISVAVTGKDGRTGQMRTDEYAVSGPSAMLTTTTESQMDEETKSRFIVITVDESADMTKRIHEAQRFGDTLEGLKAKLSADAVQHKHWNAQRLLRQLHVVNPFSKYLDFPSTALSARRDHLHYLALIKAVAFLHQHRKQVKKTEHEGRTIQYIEVDLEDIERANKLAHHVFGRTLDELSAPARRLLDLVRKMLVEMAAERGSTMRELRFRRRDVRTFTGWSDTQIRTYLRELEELEYVFATQGKWGKEYVYELLYQGGGEDGAPVFLALTEVDELRRRWTENRK